MGVPLNWIFGIHAVETVLKTAPQRVLELHVQRERRDQRLQKILRLAQQSGIEVQQVSGQQLDTRADGRHQGVMARCTDAPVQDEKFLGNLVEKAGARTLLLILDGVTDPHNLGACLRSADAAGVQAVIVPKDNSARLTPVVEKVACGAAASVPLVVVTNLARTLESLAKQGVWILGTSDRAEQSLYDIDLRGPIALVLGSEDQGLRQLTARHCDYLAALPMAGAVSSLNVSVAAGICLFEAVRQRRASEKSAN